MAIAGFELHTVQTEYVAADMIIWKRYLGRARGMMELMMDANPHLAFVHRTTPFIPAGVIVRVPIDPSLMLNQPPSMPQDSLWTDRQGYTLRGAPGVQPAPSLPVSQSEPPG